ncbi:MAG TPA: MarR family transcriptional regulator [Herpetosiphonaceae bacterium]
MTAPSDEALRLTNHLCFDLYAASRAVTKAYRPLLEPLGLTYPQYIALLVLWEHGPRTIKELGAELQLDSGTLSPLLKRLEQAGIIRRERRASDEREVEISLTEQGAALRERAEGVPMALACKIGLDVEDFFILQRILRTLLGRLHAEEQAD